MAFTASDILEEFTESTGSVFRPDHDHEKGNPGQSTGGMARASLSRASFYDNLKGGNCGICGVQKRTYGTRCGECVYTDRELYKNRRIDGLCGQCGEPARDLRHQDRRPLILHQVCGQEFRDVKALVRQEQGVQASCRAQVRKVQGLSCVDGQEAMRAMPGDQVSLLCCR